MQEGSKGIGMVHVITVDSMGRDRLDNRPVHAGINEQANKGGGDSGNVHGNHLHTILSNLRKSTKMATFKISVIILNFLGGSSFFYSFLTAILPASWLAEIHLTDIREPYKTFIIIMGILWIAQKIYAGYQQGRAKRIENDEREYEFHLKKQEHPIKHH